MFVLARVKAVLRRGPVNRSSTLRIGDLELDRLTQQVRRGGRRVELTLLREGGAAKTQVALSSGDRLVIPDM